MAVSTILSSCRDTCRACSGCRERFFCRGGIFSRRWVGSGRADSRFVTPTREFTRELTGQRQTHARRADLSADDRTRSTAALRGLVEAIIRHAEPHDVHWFGYQKYDPSARDAVARSLSQARGQHFQPADIAITAGGFGAIAAALLAVIEVGDEVCYPRPGWFAYGAVIRGAAGIPVPVDLVPESFDLDVEAIAAAIGPRTVVVNTPHNPTGRIYPRAQLDALA